MDKGFFTLSFRHYKNQISLFMTKQLLLIVSIAFVGYWNALAQTEDPVLFTVENTPVNQSEFVYIYSKTNGKKADFSKKSLEEYLELYVNFKLKVQRAKEMQLDTIPQLMKELDGYRKQLSDSYLIDREVTDRLIKEAYDRAKQDVDISHIMISVPPNATPEDTLKARQKAIAAKKRIESGEDFATVAGEISNDKSAKKNGGRIGFVTILFPNGFYPLESGAYSQEVGQLSDPIRTRMGYHILKVHERRPARGEIEAAHILIRNKKDQPGYAKTLIDSLYQVLMLGSDFEKMAQQFSEDQLSAAKGGKIGFFGINRYEKNFEDAAFSVATDGAVSEPFESSLGWHVIKRISKKEIQPFNIEKSRLEAKIKKDSRFETARSEMIRTIKSESNFTENTAVLDEFIGTLADTFLTFKWKAPAEKSPKVLFTLGDDYKTSLGDFTDYLGRSTRQRIRMGRNKALDEAVKELYNNFVNDQCLSYEESKLEEKYPEFKSLMREYEEGILLFEATKMLVWDKASQDTVGLQKYFDDVKGTYRWGERAVYSVYKIGYEQKDQVADIRAFAATHSPEEVLAKFNTADKTVIAYEEKKYEKGRFPKAEGIDWKAGSMTQTEENSRNKSISFIKIERILEPAMKTLKEARGYVVADYQDQLEKEWVKTLRDKYDVKINQEVLNNLVKK